MRDYFEICDTELTNDGSEIHVQIEPIVDLSEVSNDIAIKFALK